MDGRPPAKRVRSHDPYIGLIEGESYAVAPGAEPVFPSGSDWKECLGKINEAPCLQMAP